MESYNKLRRNYGYDIVINTFEPQLRVFLANEIFIPHYGGQWFNKIPKGVLIELNKFKEIENVETYEIEDFFEELTLLNLKDIIVSGDNFKYSKSFFGDLSKDKFVELMDDLNTYRRKIAHAKSTFSEFDLVNVIDHVTLLCQGEKGQSIVTYIKNEAYKNAKDIPTTFFEEDNVPNNLPNENYDLDGGFVGRDKEIKAIRGFITAAQDRVITITGAGGVGKTAIALKVAYSFLSDPNSPFAAIIWFSAKSNKLTDGGIIPMTPEITSYEKFIQDILYVLDKQSLKSFKQAKVSVDAYTSYLNDFFLTHTCLLIIDNLETIKDTDIISFVENIPRPSQVLITSRKGLGEFERRYPITDMLEKDALLLFRIVSKEKDRKDLLQLKETTILQLVNRVKCYPLLIKWAIGQVCLGKEVDKAFSQIFSGESEIAKFVFNDIFEMLSSNSQEILFSMSIFYEDKPITRYFLMHLANLNDDQFEEAIKELTLTSLVFPENKDGESGTFTQFKMLELTEGFIETKLDKLEKTKFRLVNRLHELSKQIEDFEKSQSSFYQSLISLGIKTPEEQVAFTYIKAAKNFYTQGDVDNAEKNYELALRIAPNLSYVLTEYSKFEYSRQHFSDSISLAERAVKLNPENFHVWYNLGIIYERNLHYNKAVDCFKKGKELNPQYLPIYTELGRAYSFSGEYEKSELEFISAIREEKYPNYRHKVFTLQSAAENYRRWAESFKIRGDTKGILTMLNNAMDSIKKAIEIAPTDRFVWRIFHKICVDEGIYKSKYEGFEVGKTLFEKCFQPILINGKKILPDNDIASAAYYYLSLSALETAQINKEQMELWIAKGMQLAHKPHMIEKFTHLKEQMKISELNPDIRNKGAIKFFNVRRQFGIISGTDSTYLFFIDGFRDRQTTEDLYRLQDKKVSFKLIKNPIRVKELIAIDITFDDQI